jgi:hypothetical protein
MSSPMPDYPFHEKQACFLLLQPLGVTHDIERH